LKKGVGGISGQSYNQIIKTTSFAYLEINTVLFKNIGLILLPTREVEIPLTLPLIKGEDMSFPL